MTRIVFPSLLVLMACTNKETDGTSRASDTSEPSTEEDGCIRINGAGSWSTIDDALDNAVDGDVIYLCSGTYAERVVIEKSVTIKGPNTGEPAIVVGTEIDSTVSIRADGVTLSWITIQSEDVGVFVRAVDGTLLQATLQVLHESK